MEENEQVVEQAPVEVETGTEEVVETAEQPNREDNQQTNTEERLFKQDEVSKIVAKEVAKTERRLKRQQEQQAPQQQQPQRLDPAQFASPEAYIEALAEQKAARKIAEREQASQHRQIVDAYQEREDDARERFPDFDSVAYNPNLPISDVMAISIQASDLGPDIAYHLGQNPKDAARIAKMPPLLQAKEIGKLEAKLSVEKERPKASAAPEPIKPVGVKGAAVKRVEDMSDDEFAEHRRKIRAARR